MPAHNGKKQAVNIKMPHGGNNSVLGPHSSHTLPTLSVSSCHNAVMEWSSGGEAARPCAPAQAQGTRWLLRRKKGVEIVSGYGELEGLSHNTVGNIQSPRQKSTSQAKTENSKYPKQKLGMSKGQHAVALKHGEENGEWKLRQQDQHRPGT